MMPRADRLGIANPGHRTLLLLLAAALAIPVLMLFADRPIAIAMQGLPAGFKNLAADITLFGKSLSWLLLSAAAAGFWAWHADRAERPSDRHARCRARAWTATFLFAAVALSGILANIIKLAIGRLRPDRYLGEGAYGFQPWNLESDLRGFPSGHATTVFALAFAIALIRPAWRWPAFAAATLVAATRVILNAHYLSDTIGGLLLAFVTVLWLRRLFRRRGWPVLDGNEAMPVADQKPRMAP
ncbi:phosphatase PAP2 family protein [Hypericibacter adhaerens]|uniref:Phosphatase PAP2 family protein n=2 Tax=Hypericibacter adhaerens TaxID=2602016 RepID=A0A5J6N1B0_9PROT|nr:phosphatase PAP2 family protein [Hypericibacter adhaerens]